MINNFVALDFETASGKNPCSIGIVEFERGKIVSQYYSLINPMIDEFNPIAVRIHGIKREDVENQRNFNEIWGEIKHYFVNKNYSLSSIKYRYFNFEIFFRKIWY